AEQTIRRGIAVSQTAAPTGFLYLGHILVEQKAWDRAVQAYRDALAINPSFEPAYLGMAATLEAKGDTAQAIAVLRKVLQEVNTGNREARQRLVRLLLTQKAYEPALALLREAIQESPGDVEAQLRIGLIYGELKDYVKAVEQIKLVLALRPQELRVRDHLAYLFEELVHEMEEAIRLDPKHADALNYLGYTYAERDMRLEEAVALIQRALAVKPQNGYYLDSLAWAYYKMGRFQEALAEMKRAVAVVPDDPVFLEHLGDIFL